MELGVELSKILFNTLANVVVTTLFAGDHIVKNGVVIAIINFHSDVDTARIHLQVFLSNLRDPLVQRIRRRHVQIVEGGASSVLKEDRRKSVGDVVGEESDGKAVELEDNTDPLVLEVVRISVVLSRLLPHTSRIEDSPLVLVRHGGALSDEVTVVATPVALAAGLSVTVVLVVLTLNDADTLIVVVAVTNSNGTVGSSVVLAVRIADAAAIRVVDVLRVLDGNDLHIIEHLTKDLVELVRQSFLEVLEPLKRISGLKVAVTKDISTEEEHRLLNVSEVSLRGSRVVETHDIESVGDLREHSQEDSLEVVLVGLEGVEGDAGEVVEHIEADGALDEGVAVVDVVTPSTVTVPLVVLNDLVALSDDVAALREVLIGNGTVDGGRGGHDPVILGVELLSLAAAAGVALVANQDLILRAGDQAANIGLLLIGIVLIGDGDERALLTLGLTLLILVQLAETLVILLGRRTHVTNTADVDVNVEIVLVEVVLVLLSSHDGVTLRNRLAELDLIEDGLIRVVALGTESRRLLVAGSNGALQALVAVPVAADVGELLCNTQVNGVTDTVLASSLTLQILVIIVITLLMKIGLAIFTEGTLETSVTGAALIGGITIFSKTIFSEVITFITVRLRCNGTILIGLGESSMKVNSRERNQLIGSIGGGRVRTNTTNNNADVGILILNILQVLTSEVSGLLRSVVLLPENTFIDVIKSNLEGSSRNLCSTQEGLTYGIHISWSEIVNRSIDKIITNHVSSNLDLEVRLELVSIVSSYSGGRIIDVTLKGRTLHKGETIIGN